jgi:hypothetical protein
VCVCVGESAQTQKMNGLGCFFCDRSVASECALQRGGVGRGGGRGSGAIVDGEERRE